MKDFFDLIVSLIQITGNDTVDGILLSLIGFLSFSVAFGVVGFIFDLIGVYDSDVMSGCHFIIRLITFLSLSVFFTFVFNVLKWLFSFQWWVYFIVIILVVLTIILIHYLKHKYMSRKNKIINIASDYQKSMSNDVPLISNSVVSKKDTCPRCGGNLVKRYGPYGAFYGCSNFPKNRCKYTRRFK